MFTSSGSTGGRGGDAKTIISPNTSFGDIINIIIQRYIYAVKLILKLPILVVVK